MRHEIAYYYLPLGANGIALTLNIYTLAVAAWRGDWPANALAVSVAIGCSAAAIMLLPWAYFYGKERAAKAAAERDICDLVLERMNANPQGIEFTAEPIVRKH